MICHPESKKSRTNIYHNMSMVREEIKSGLGVTQETTTLSTVYIFLLLLYISEDIVTSIGAYCITWKLKVTSICFYYYRWKQRVQKNYPHAKHIMMSMHLEAVLI